MYPLSNHADAAHKAAMVGENLIAGRGDVIAAAGADGLDRSDHFLFLLALDALHFAIDLFRRSHSATRRVHVQDDGFDRTVVPELLELPDYDFRRDNYPFQVHHPNLVSETAEGGLGTAAAHGHVH